MTKYFVATAETQFVRSVHTKTKTYLQNTNPSWQGTLLVAQSDTSPKQEASHTDTIFISAVWETLNRINFFMVTFT